MRLYHEMGTLVGYARVSTLDQKPELQLDALKAAGCSKQFVDKISSAKEDRPQLKAALDYLRPGDTLVVWKLDCLARSIKQLIDTVDALKAKNMGADKRVDPPCPTRSAIRSLAPARTT